jgi:hypothetical protein
MYLLSIKCVNIVIFFNNHVTILPQVSLTFIFIN